MSDDNLMICKLLYEYEIAFNIFLYNFSFSYVSTTYYVHIVCILCAKYSKCSPVEKIISWAFSIVSLNCSQFSTGLRQLKQHILANSTDLILI